jgi:hypothetical protein
MGRKVSDRFTVPICQLHHRELHRRANERVWWQNQGIDPPAIAVWAKTHAVARAEAEIEGAKDRSAGINAQLDGIHLGNGPKIANQLPSLWSRSREVVLRRAHSPATN